MLCYMSLNVYAYCTVVHSGENELKISVLVVRKVLKKKLNLKNFVLNKNTVLVRHIGT